MILPVKMLEMAEDISLRPQKLYICIVNIHKFLYHLSIYLYKSI